MLPSRPTNPATPPIAFPQHPYEAVKKRVLAKLEDRVDLSASKRMPQSLLRHTLRQQAEQIAELEGRGLTRADRERLIEESLVELFGYGPLEELFADAAVREVMVTGPAAVISRREQGQWMPTSVTFRDEAHVRSVLDKIAAHADAVGPVMTSVGTFDMKLPNGFRAIAVIPPPALGRPATAAFIRETAAPAAVPAATNAVPASPTSSTSHGTLKTVPPTAAVSPRVPGSGLTTTPPPRTAHADSPTASTSGAHDPLSRHRSRILERLLTKFARLGLYDATKLDVNELRKIITAYVGEYADAERIYLSDTDQGRLTLEVLTALRK
jgi:hypothetical protein